MKILFMGTPEFAAEVLDEINNGKNKIIGTLTPGSIALYRLQKLDEEPFAIEYYLDKGSF